MILDNFFLKSLFYKFLCGSVGERFSLGVSLYPSFQSFFMRRDVCSLVFLIFFTIFDAVMELFSTNRFNTSRSVSMILESGCFSVCIIVSFLSVLEVCWIFALKVFIRFWNSSCVFVKFRIFLYISFIRIISFLSDVEVVCIRLVKFRSFFSNL